MTSRTSDTVDEGSVKDGQHGSGWPIGDEPASDVSHIKVNEELAVVSAVLPKDRVEGRLCAQESRD